MYELINTSVPNGLIAGTHGFATVAMTKGMPDVLRMRVESLCAYPHRTSAHDQSYYTENPVNWFHLMLPSGDHVVGRTAPAEFDYTGRTNRISRVMHFGSHEMPAVGGAYVLSSEVSWFGEGWSGDPQFLKDDKLTSGKLRMAAPTSDVSPRHWIAMFGPKGQEYARRFATLLANNVCGTGKSIFFKTSTSFDSDGTRLLGLFSDLINLLPEELSAQVTFSTFSACVPNGVTCHLRGVFDRDRAFEVASTLQPWVDCENRAIKHAELLPQEEAPSDDKNANMSFAGSIVNANVSTAQGGRSKLGVRRNESSARAIKYFNDKISETKRSSSKDSAMLVAVIAMAILLCGAAIWIGVKCLTDYGGTSAGYGAETGAGDIEDDVSQPDEFGSWCSKTMKELRKLDGEVSQFNKTNETSRIIIRVQEINDEAEKRKENVRDGNRDAINNVIDKCKLLLDHVDVRNKHILDEKAQQTTPEEQGRNMRGKVGAVPVLELTANSPKNEEANTVPKLEVSASDEFKKLQSLSHCIPDGVKLEDALPLSPDEKGKLTNSGDIRFFTIVNDKIVMTNGCFEIVKEAKLRGGATRGGPKKYNLIGVPRSEKWIVISMPAIDRVFWQFRDVRPVQFFKKDPGVSKEKIIKHCFGATEAYNLWSAYENNSKAVFVIDPEDQTIGWRYYSDLSTSTNILIECEAVSSYITKIEELEGDLTRVAEKKQECQEIVTNVNLQVSAAHEALTVLKQLIKEEQDFKDGKAPNKKFMIRQKKKDIENKRKEIYNCLSNYWDCTPKVDINKAKPRDIEKKIDKIKEQHGECKHKGNHDPNALKNDIARYKNVLTGMKDKIRNALYTVSLSNEAAKGWKEIPKK